MGLFDKFKNKNNKRKEAEKYAEEVKKDLDKTLNISIAGVDISNSIKKDISQEIDDNIIREYGTDEEKSQMNKRIEQENQKKARKKKLLERYNSAKRMHDKTSIKIYQELIEESQEFPSLIIQSYHGLIETNMHIRHCDEAIAAANECIEFKKKHNEKYDYELRKIEFINKHCRHRKK